MRTLSLFSGIGGLDLGLERAGFDVVAQCEADAWCRRVLAKHWPAAALREDATALAAELEDNPDLFGDIDCVCGGFPCQDVSVAGKGVGVDAGKRSGLWRMMHHAIRTLRPGWVIAENVPALRDRGADRVLGDLEDLGYACGPVVVGASDVGAPHRRQRVFIVAHRLGGRLRGGGIAAVAGAARRMQAEQEERERLRAHAGAGGEAGAGGLADSGGGAGLGRGPRDANRLRADGHEAGRHEGDGGSGRPGTAGGDLDDTDGDGRERTDLHLRRRGQDEASGLAERAGEWGIMLGDSGGSGCEERDDAALAARAGQRGGGSDALGESARRDVGHADGVEQEAIGPVQAGDLPGSGRAHRWPSGPTAKQHRWEPRRLADVGADLERGVGGAADGLPDGLVRLARAHNRHALKAYGNAVCPQVAELIGLAVMAVNAPDREAA